MALVDDNLESQAHEQAEEETDTYPDAADELDAAVSDETEDEDEEVTSTMTKRSCEPKGEDSRQLTRREPRDTKPIVEYQANVRLH